MIVDEQVVQELERAPLAVRLTAEFYAWERWGRGWQLWDAPVSLEPPFAPFVRQGLRGPAPSIDDGRIPTIWENMASWVKAQFAKKKRPTRRTSATSPLDRPLPRPPVSTGAFVEFQVRLPGDVETRREVAEMVILSLLGCSPLVSFEFFGGGGELSLQFAVPERCASAARTALETYLPEASITKEARLVFTWMICPSRHDVFVGFGLASEFVLPLRSGRSSDMDPMLGMLAVLESLEKDEVGVVQVLMEPAHSPWAEHARRALIGPDGRPFLADAPHILSLAEEKLSRPLVATSIRVAARSTTNESAWEIVRRLGGTLAQLGNPLINELIPLDDDDYPLASQLQDLLSRQSHRSGMLLTTAELASIVRPPSVAMRAPALRAHGVPAKAAPKELDTGETLLGTTEHRGNVKEVWLNREQRLRHMHVVGGTGTGKSTLVLSLIAQDLAQGRGVAVLDPHGDLADAVLGLVPEVRVKDVVLMDPGDEEWPVGFNVLGARTDAEREALSSDFVGIFRRFSSTWGDQMGAVLGNAVMALLHSRGDWTLLDLRRFLLDKGFRGEVLGSVDDPMVREFWETQYGSLYGRAHIPILTRLDAFLRPRSLRAIVGQTGSRVDLARVMDTGGIFIARLSQGAVGEQNAHLLGSLLVAKFHQVALARERQRADERRPFYLYIDEFHHLATPSVAAMLSGVRKYGVGLVLAHQELRQVADAEVRSAVLANAGVRVVFRVGDDDARALATGFSTYQSKDLQSLVTGQAVCRVGQADADFCLRVPSPEVVDRGTREVRVLRVREASRERFARPRAEVQAEQDQRIERKQPEPMQEAPAVREVEAGALPTREQPALIDAPPDSPLKQPRISPPVTPGRGGAQHKRVQAALKACGEKHGFRATIEAAVGEAGRADLLLERDGRRIACEISISTSAAHEVENVVKCLDGGVDQVWVICESKRRVASIQRRLQESIARPVGEQVRFLDQAEAMATIEVLQTAPASETTTVLGYRVRTSVMEVHGEASKARSRSIAQTLAGALKRLGT